MVVDGKAYIQNKLWGDKSVKTIERLYAKMCMFEILETVFYSYINLVLSFV